MSSESTERPWFSCCPCVANVFVARFRRRKALSVDSDLPSIAVTRELSFTRQTSGFLRRARALRRASIATGIGTTAALRVRTDAGLQDRYQIGGDIVGEGFSGVVRIVTDRSTKNRCVLKTLRLIDKDTWDELLNEMEAYLRLDHPNICRLLEVYAEENACHLIMELCTGKDLCDRFNARGKYSEQDACTAVAQMLDAVAYMHNNHICHRDLKLENWVYADASEHARLKLIDFGLSEFVTPDAPMTAILGTIFYVAPEVLGRSYNNKCDVWSTGVLTYMLLSGVPPFGDFDDNDITIFKKILHGGPATMEGPRWAHVSDDAKDFVAALLERDPYMRPSAQEMKQHPWMAKLAAGNQHSSAKELSVRVLENLRDFASMNVMKRAACDLIALSMSVDDTDWLEAQFKKLDKHNDGKILLQELADALKDHLGMAEDASAELIKRLDLAGDKKLKYSEFLAAVNQKRFMGQERTIQKAFQRFDLDQTGVITLENLRTVLGNEFNGTPVEEILREVDLNGNGVIEYEEFLRALMDLGSFEGNSPSKLCNGSPTHRERIQNISRAFELTSVGAPIGSVQKELLRRRSKGRPQMLGRGWRSQDNSLALSPETSGSLPRVISNPLDPVDEFLESQPSYLRLFSEPAGSSSAASRSSTKEMIVRSSCGASRTSSKESVRLMPSDGTGHII